MSPTHDYESEVTATREETAAALSGVADGVLAGRVRVGDGEDAVVVDIPEEMTLEIEVETEDENRSLELELEWPRAEGEAAAATDAEAVPEATSDEEPPGAAGEKLPDAAGEEELPEAATGGELPDAAGEEEPVPVGAADGSQLLARFELFRDRADEWRWRLRHRNRNVIATSGEGYTRKHNARKGLRSVVQNAPDAEVLDESDI